MRRKDLAGPGREPPVLLVKWYDLTRWILEKVDSFPKSQRFVFGTRLADHAFDVLETLVEASYSSTKAALLADANRKVETLRWLVRLAKDRKVLTERQYLFACQGMVDCVRIEELGDGGPGTGDRAKWQASPFATGPWCWLLDNIRRVRSSPEIQGKQGLWNLDPAMIESLEY